MARSLSLVASATATAAPNVRRLIAWAPITTTESRCAPSACNASRSAARDRMRRPSGSPGLLIALQPSEELFCFGRVAARTGHQVDRHLCLAGSSAFRRCRLVPGPYRLLLSDLPEDLADAAMQDQLPGSGSPAGSSREMTGWNSIEWNGS